MDKNEFARLTYLYCAKWLEVLTKLIAEGTKIEPEQKRKLIATSISIVLYLQDEFDSILNGSAK